MAAKQPTPKTFAELSGNTGSLAQFNSRALQSSPRLWRFAEGGGACQFKQTGAVDVALDVVCQSIQRRLDVGLVGEIGRLVCNAPQPVVVLPGVGKQPV